MPGKVFITRRISESAITLLESKLGKVAVSPHDRPLTRDELLENLGDCVGLLCMLTDRMDAAAIEAAPKLKVIANHAVGFDNIDVAAATRRKIAVTNTPDVLNDATADMAWALLFAAARRVAEGDRGLRAGNFPAWGPAVFLGADITGTTLGIVGAGRIGSAMARKSIGFKMPVLYCDHTPRTELGRDLHARKVGLDELLRESDFVSVHVPLLPETRHLIGRDQLRMMKTTAVLVNTSRGPVIDESALVEALRERRIAAAGLDVYENEPRLAPGLAELANVVLTPHIASATPATRRGMAEMAARNIVAALTGEAPPNCLNREIYG